MTGLRQDTLLVLILRAVALGIVWMMVLPVIAFLIVMASGYLAGACGPGSSGGCEMGAGVAAIYAVVPGFVVGATISVFRDLRKRRSPKWRRCPGPQNER